MQYGISGGYWDTAVRKENRERLDVGDY